MLTWDNGLKRGWICPNRCTMCEVNQETTQHLFVSCSFAQYVMAEVSKLINIYCQALEGNLLVWLKNWNDNVGIKGFISLPFFLIYFLWWDLNLCIFQDKYLSPVILVALVANLTREFKCEVKSPKKKETNYVIYGQRNALGFFQWG